MTLDMPGVLLLLLPQLKGQSRICGGESLNGGLASPLLAKSEPPEACLHAGAGCKEKKTGCRMGSKQGKTQAHGGAHGGGSGGGGRVGGCVDGRCAYHITCCCTPRNNQPPRFVSGQATGKMQLLRRGCSLSARLCCSRVAEHRPGKGKYGRVLSKFTHLPLRRSGSVDVAVCKAWMQRPKNKAEGGQAPE